jgi:hypothetical protein
VAALLWAAGTSSAAVIAAIVQSCAPHRDERNSFMAFLSF